MGASGRLDRERRTVLAMIRLYCRARHGGPEPCGECRALGEYAAGRLARCPFSEDKPTCADCPVHCYAPAMRERIREVMRWAGPRMLWRHPILAVRHLLDGRRRPRPARPATSR
ncbi:MAG TPA: nitrous oxide-stimulated promoter family protein [Thermoanaerobaculaceae bacterium]|nr:nitrous oxide-stimulated promoter family protein [Thermoanaerobaculaceae bacterium]HRS14877.1 nitrous oxide-stimulated promoter family protein [Thermoanaerobaculaceae bacterium]